MAAEGQIENRTARIVVSGRIDTGNAAETEREIRAVLEKGPVDELVIDAGELAYISSAGLRVLLRLSKQYPRMRIENVSLDVYEIFEMTGFTEMITIEKAYRTVSVEGCEVIGEGANGKIYRTDPETIVKVYRDPDSLDEIKNEREVARRAFVLGIPTAISYDIVRVGDGYASVFELLNADSMAKLVREHPENIDEYIRLYTDLLKLIHGTAVPKGQLPDHKQIGLGWVEKLKGRIDDTLHRRLEEMMRAVPARDHMLHGDYHVKNVMIQDGEALLIDMDTLAVGDPVFEFAAMYLGYAAFGALDHSVTERFLGIKWEQAQYILKTTLRLYLGTDDEAVLEKMADKARLCCYIRLTRRTMEREPDNTAFLEHCMACLEEYAGKVTSLSFL